MITPDRVKSVRRNLAVVSVVAGVLGVLILGIGLLSAVSMVMGQCGCYWLSALLGLGLGGYLIWSAVGAVRIENRIARGDIPEKFRAAMEVPPPSAFAKAVSYGLLATTLAIAPFVLAGAVPPWTLLVLTAAGLGLIAHGQRRIRAAQKKRP